MVNSSERENNIFGLSVIRELINKMERLYEVTKDERLFEPITSLYTYIENYGNNIKDFEQ